MTRLEPPVTPISIALAKQAQQIERDQVNRVLRASGQRITEDGQIVKEPKP